ncbi:hypothetical protein BOTBODRAFT_172669 [Botryobasidium botryosum FD-172 SS1]|uniref:Uncharacterized protein n=1 Tax=Botryobasidium botryosum (strain FD-172 SS1) TaxID=930990 RepID=A0A067MMR9_BOTB1|nr:hypothetical protein BOTBODRAFT_172669 [Botryobasidium botryosum FD-172 SS1]
MTAVAERVPAEILVQIFEIRLKDRGYGHSTHDLLRFSLVYRFWRAAIQGCPTLWSDIWLDVPTCRSMERQAAYQLKRAGSTLLSLTIRFPYVYDVETPVAALPARLANIFRDTMVRWKSFEMHAHPHAVQSFLSRCAGSTPNLSKLTITFKDLTRSFLPSLSIPFQRPVQAESGPPVVASIGHFLPRYASLGAAITRLSVRVLTFRLHDFTTMLLSCPNLVQFDLAGSDSVRNGRMGDTSHPVIVPLLHLLDLRMSYIDEPAPLLESVEFISFVDAPSLTELSLLMHKIRPISSYDPTLVCDLIDRSCPPLRRLSLTWIGLADEDIIWCLQKLPLLEELVIIGGAMSDATLRALAIPPPTEQGADQEVLLPRLRRANLWSPHTTEQGLKALAACRNTVTWKHG